MATRLTAGLMGSVCPYPDLGQGDTWDKNTVGQHGRVEHYMH